MTNWFPLRRVATPKCVRTDPLESGLGLLYLGIPAVRRRLAPERCGPSRRMGCPCAALDPRVHSLGDSAGEVISGYLISFVFMACDTFSKILHNFNCIYLKLSQ